MASAARGEEVVIAVSVEGVGTFEVVVWIGAALNALARRAVETAGLEWGSAVRWFLADAAGRPLNLWAALAGLPLVVEVPNVFCTREPIRSDARRQCLTVGCGFETSVGETAWTHVVTTGHRLRILGAPLLPDKVRGVLVGTVQLAAGPMLGLVQDAVPGGAPTVTCVSLIEDAAASSASAAALVSRAQTQVLGIARVNTAQLRRSLRRVAERVSEVRGELEAVARLADPYERAADEAGLRLLLLAAHGELAGRVVEAGLMTADAVEEYADAALRVAGVPGWELDGWNPYLSVWEASRVWGPGRVVVRGAAVAALVAAAVALDGEIAAGGRP